jgi:hypothetical protein
VILGTAAAKIDSQKIQLNTPAKKIPPAICATSFIESYAASILGSSSVSTISESTGVEVRAAKLA